MNRFSRLNICFLSATAGILICIHASLSAAGEEYGPCLPGTRPLTRTGDIASELVAGVDRFLLKQIEDSSPKREKHWKRDFRSLAAYAASIEPNRKRLAHILGVREPLASFDTVALTDGAGVPVTAAAREPFALRSIRWPAFADVTGEGLEAEPIKPNGASSPVTIIVIPDADQAPEQLFGLTPGLPATSQVARRLAENGYHVVVPVLIDRTVVARNGRAKLTNREFIYRSAFELGRHIIGYEVMKVLSLVNHAAGRRPDQGEAGEPRVGLFGYGEGGAIALYAAALDQRINAVCVSGYFDDRNDTWRQPVDRNVFGLLEQFGDAEVSSLIAPRTLIVEAAKGPEFLIPPGTGGAPGRLTTPRLETVRKEVDRANTLVAPLAGIGSPIKLVTSGDAGTGPFGCDRALEQLVAALSPGAKRLEPAKDSLTAVSSPREATHKKARQDRQLHELDRHNQELLAESPAVRREFMKKLDVSSLDAFTRTVEPYREFFANEVIGKFEQSPLPPAVRTRKIYDEAKFAGYEVEMDVFPDVIAYGLLLLPKAIPPGEKRPVVVCQHGLEGRPSDLADPKFDSPYYHRFAVRLAEEGFITFAPQNLYIFQDRFRTLQRKANPLKKTLFSVIVPQHQQITDWLKTLPAVNPARIAFYGLSYGGKSAMRIPPLVKNYCLSICSADFNEWVWKNTSTNNMYSYVWTPEYEIFEYDLGSTFNYAEMAALIAPRPFMVERGHFDGVSSDEAVAYEYAKVFFLYDAKLGIGDRCAIEVFNGPHMINGKGTFAFLHKHLKW